MLKLSIAERVIFSFLLFVAALLLARMWYAHNWRYVFLLWNLFLAWIPFQLSISLSLNQQYHRWVKYSLVMCWLLFFPNALYIITDLIHLDGQGDKVPVWFDAVLLFTSSITGLLLAFISLYQVEVIMRKNISAKHVNKLIVASLFLGSFGVYIGRFLRWNSWDILANPASLVVEIAAHFTNPFLHYRTWMITVLLTCLFCLLYFSAKRLPQLFTEVNKANRKYL